MGTYLFLGTYTAQGAAGLLAEGGRARESETRAFFASLGGQVLHYGFTRGEFDFIVLADLPDDSAATVPPLVVNSTGTARVRSVPVMTAEQMDAACSLARGAAFRAAGQGT